MFEIDINIDSAQQFIITKLQEACKKSMLHYATRGLLADRGYDICFNLTFVEFKKSVCSVSPLTHIPSDTMTQIENKCKVCLSDALWDLCRKNILRPGVSYQNSIWSPTLTVNDGFSVTEYGKKWLLNFNIEDLLPADPHKLSSAFTKHQIQYGMNYYKRAKEAVNCYLSGNYLACCVMCGAATESILLSAAILKTSEQETLSQYKTAKGRRNIENLVFGKTDGYIKNYYSKYLDLLSFWRDETGHGHDTNVDCDEAYVSMITLLRFAKFMEEHWSVITTKIYTQLDKATSE